MLAADEAAMKHDGEFRLEDYLLQATKQVGNMSSLGAYAATPAPTPAPRRQVIDYASSNVVSLDRYRQRIGKPVRRGD